MPRAFDSPNIDQNKGKITTSKRLDLTTKLCNSKVFEVHPPTLFVMLKQMLDVTTICKLDDIVYRMQHVFVRNMLVYTCG